MWTAAKRSAGLPAGLVRGAAEDGGAIKRATGEGRRLARWVPAIIFVLAPLIACAAANSLVPQISRGTQPEAKPSASTWLARGAAAYKIGHWAEAEHDLTEALRLDARLAPAHALLGLALARTGNLNGGLAELRQAHELDPANSDFAYDESVLLIQQNEYSPAIPILENLRAKEPQSSEIVVNLARAYAGAGESTKLSALVSALPPTAYQDEHLLKTLGSLLTAARQPGAAERLWESTIQHDPSLPLAYAALAKLLITSNNPRRALTLLGGAPAAARGPVWLYAEGEAEMALRSYDEAIQTFLALTRLLPRSQSAWSQLVRCCILRGRLTKADEFSAEASEKFPGAPEFRYENAVVNYMLGRSSFALRELRPVLEKQSDDPRPLLLMAVLQSEQGNYTDATRYFTQVERMTAGSNALVFYFYGVTLLRLHRPQSAEAQFESALRCRPHFALAEFRMGQALEQDGKLREALSALEQSIRDDPVLAEPYYARAQIERRLGEPAKAQTALRKFNQLHKSARHSDRSLFRGEE